MFSRSFGLLVLASVLVVSPLWAVNPVAPKLVTSADTGAETMSGTAGELLRLLDTTLIIHYAYTAVSGASFVDNSTAARLQGSTAWKAFQGPTATNDEFYMGYQAKFEQVVLVFGTPGVQNATVTMNWQYWNGSAWTTFTPDSDTTTKFTANGTVAWTIANLTNWTTTTVNTKTQYWIRARFTAGSWTTNPLIQTASLIGWTRAFSGTNQAVYQQGAGNLRYLEVDDAGTGTPKDARIRAWETCPTWTSYGTNTCTLPFPTVVQFANGLFLHKSSTANTTTRGWKIWADDRAFYTIIDDGNLAGTVYNINYFGDVYSLVTSDPYRTVISGNITEGTSTSSTVAQLLYCDTSIAGAAGSGTYIDRDYQGSVSGSKLINRHTDIVKVAGSSGCLGIVQYPNGTDGNLYAERMFLHEASTSTIRGYLRGMLLFLHAPTNIANGDILGGAAGSAFSGRSYQAVKYACAFNTCNNGVGIVVLMETTNTVDTN